MIHVEIKRGGSESAMSVLKRFTRKMQSAGVVNRVKSLRYAERKPSAYVKKKRALKVLGKKAETERLAKLGKLPVRAGR